MGPFDLPEDEDVYIDPLTRYPDPEEDEDWDFEQYEPGWDWRLSLY
jgi:hypothetical protein